MGRIAFIWDLKDDTVYPITAYEVPAPGLKKRRRRR
jgi:hypothetical protein